VPWQVHVSIAEAMTDLVFGSEHNHKEGVRRGAVPTMYEIASAAASVQAQVTRRENPDTLLFAPTAAPQFPREK
jgi:hypothetical protein